MGVNKNRKYIFNRNNKKYIFNRNNKKYIFNRGNKITENIFLTEIIK